MSNASEKHPCFNEKAKKIHGRVHLPIAPKCNIQCNYCNRAYDCVNESRPGVTSAVLAPFQAVHYLKTLVAKHPEISVVGIAGPGDPFAQPEVTMPTLRMIKQEMPDMVMCLSSNGLNIRPYIDELKELEVEHVTITINSLDVNVLKDIYPWIRHEQRTYRGLEGAKILLEQQLLAVAELKEKGFTVKVNTIVIPGLNDIHIPELAAKLGEMGVDFMNPIPIYPVKDTPFENVEHPAKGLMKDLKEMISNYVEPMKHCARCRADAAGLLGHDIDDATRMIREAAQLKKVDKSHRKYVAVATHEGMLVNQHLGEAEQLYIFSEGQNGYKLEGQRPTPKSGTGMERWKNLCETIGDCRALLVGGAGATPFQYISDTGIEIIEMTGLIDMGLDHIFKGTSLKTVKKRDAFKCGSECAGTGSGCG